MYSLSNEKWDLITKEFTSSRGRITPLRKYVNKSHLDLDKVNLEDLIDEFMFFNHHIVDGYVYGLKQVTSEYQGMFGKNTYIVGQKYTIQRCRWSK